jgi:ADP-ribose pyrophosphatase YjhB (NUDIX family)
MTDDDRYPRQPRAAALAVVPRAGASGPELLMVRRAGKPDPDRWGFPGGKVHLGEGVLAAARRELAEETGVRADALAPVWAGDVIEHDITGAVVTHFVLAAVLFRWRAGDGVAADDATEAAWMTLPALGSLPEERRFPDVLRLARLGLGIFNRWPS